MLVNLAPGLERKWYHFSKNKPAAASQLAIKNIESVIEKLKIRAEAYHLEVRLRELLHVVRNSYEISSDDKERLYRAWGKLANNSSKTSEQVEDFQKEIYKAGSAEKLQRIINLASENQRDQISEKLNAILLLPLAANDLAQALKEKEKLLATIEKIPKENRISILNKTLTITNSVKTKKSDCASLVNAILKNDYFDVGNLNLSFFDKIGDFFCYSNLFNLTKMLNEFPANDRQAALDFVDRYMSLLLASKKILWISTGQVEAVLKLLVVLPTNKWNALLPFDPSDLVQFSRRKVPEQEKFFRFYRALERHEAEQRQGNARILSLLETPFNEELAIDGRRVNYSAGINVHERDKQVREAIELLRAKQGELDDAERDQLVASFIEYANAEPNAEKKEKVLRALNGGQEAQSNFPSLLDRTDTFSILGLEIEGREVIARLWKFIQEMEDKADQEIAKAAMIIALSQCFNDDGSRICNPGKVQHLFVAVLQGRLEGVQIDKMAPIDAIMMVPTTQAVQMFSLYPENQGHEELIPLLRAAGKFADENPGVNRKEFLIAVEKTINFNELTRDEREAIEVLANITQLLADEEKIRADIEYSLAQGLDPYQLLLKHQELEQKLQQIQLCPEQNVLEHYTQAHNGLHPEATLSIDQLLRHYQERAGFDLHELSRLDLVKKLEYLIVESEAEKVRNAARALEIAEIEREQQTELGAGQPNIQQPLPLDLPELRRRRLAALVQQ
jgi:hypothetical protein